MMEFVFEGTIQDGKLELEYKHMPFEPTDPKPDRASTSDNELKRHSCEWESRFDPPTEATGEGEMTNWCYNRMKITGPITAATSSW